MLISSNFYFDPDAKGAALFMGATEAQLMELIWVNNSLTVKRALVLISSKPKPAYTTIMTILNRLVQKKLLKRTKDGRHFVYQATISRKEFLSQKVALVKKGLTTC